MIGQQMGFMMIKYFLAAIFSILAISPVHAQSSMEGEGLLKINIIHRSEQPIVGDTEWYIFRRGDLEVFAPVTDTTEFEKVMPYGIYEVEVLVNAEEGIYQGAQIFMFNEKFQNGYVIETELSPNFIEFPMTVSYYCELDKCEYDDERTGLSWEMPGGWGAERPYYYETVGGAVAEKPTILMMSDTAVFVSLNLRKRDASLGPCFEIAQGEFCHDETDDPEALEQIEIIKNSLDGSE